MMTVLVMFVLLVAGAVTQWVLPAPGWLAQAKPPLLAGVVLYYALNRETGPMLLSAFLAGLLQDVFSAVPLGWTSAMFCVVGLAVGRFRRLVLTESVATAGFFGAVTGLAVTLVTYGLLARAHLALWPAGRLTVKALAVAVLGAVATPLVFAVAHRLDQWVGNVRVREIVDGIEQPLGF